MAKAWQYLFNSLQIIIENGIMFLGNNAFMFFYKFQYDMT